MSEMVEDLREGESKRDRFVRLAESRTSNALRAIRLIGNLANKVHYDYTEADLKKIVNTLHKEVDAMAKRFEDVQPKAKGFKL